MTSRDAAERFLLMRNLADSLHQRQGLPILAEADTTPRQRVEQIGYWLELAADGDSEAWTMVGAMAIAGFVAADAAEQVRPETGAEAA